MGISSDSPRSGYTILRAVLDPLRGITVPVGTASWDSDAQEFRLRVLASDERLSQLPVSRRAVMDLTAGQLLRWARERRIPYNDQSFLPWESDFWAAASNVLTASLVLDPPKPMRPVSGPDELEALFEAIVQPKEKASRREGKINRALAQALGPLTSEVRPNLPVLAFHEREEKVKRGYSAADGVVIVEGVNLAGTAARRDADALVSKLWRIIEGQRRQVRIIIGYRASPGGLNGEADMKAWMEEQLGPDVYDVNREAPRLQEAAHTALLEFRPNPPPAPLFQGGKPDGN